MATTAKLRTTNKSAIYNQLRADFYKNVNQIMRDQYSKGLEAQNALLDEDSPTFIGNVLAGTVGFAGAVAFDIVGGFLGGIGNATTGIVQLIADFADNAYDIFDPTDGRGWQEDLAFTITSLGGDIVKGLGTAGFSIAGFGGELLGIEGSMEFGQEQSRRIEKGVNRVMGQTLEEARYGNPFIRTIGAMALGESIPELRYQDRETEFDNSDYIKQYINERHDPNSASSVVKRGMTSANKWYQNNIVEPMFKNVLDKTVSRSFAGDFYNQYVEPAAQSIGEIVPAMLMTMKGSKASSARVGEIFNNLGRAYFASNVYGRSYQEAVESGATENDAHLYGISNAGLEMTTEYFGGFVPGKPLSQSYKSVLKSIASEGLEEFVAEVAQPGLNFWLNEERNFENVSPSELLERAFYSAIVGGISGGIFGGIGKVTSKTSPEANIETLNREFQKIEGKRNDAVIQREVAKLEQNLNDPNIPQWRKQQILDNPLYRELVQEISIDAPISPMSIVGGPSKVQKQNVGRGYQLTDVGSRVARGDFVAKQGDVSVTKETHAVGSQEMFANYLESNQYGDIDLVLNEEITSLPQKQQEDIEFFRKNNMRVAPMRQNPIVNGIEVPAFVDLNTGVVYVNVNAKRNQEGFKAAFAHEIYHNLESLYDKGVLTKKQYETYNKFNDSIENGEFDAVLEQVGWKQLEEIYALQVMTPQQRKVAEESGWESVELNEAQEARIDEEKKAVIIDKVFDNETILKRAYAQKPSLIRSIANVFSNTKKIKNEFNVTDGYANEMLNNIQRNFQNLLRDTREFAFGAETIAEGLLQRRMFSMERYFTNDAYMVNIHKPTYEVNEQFQLALVTRSAESMMSIVGFDPTFDISKEYPSVQETKKKIDQQYFRLNRPSMIEGSIDADYYQSIEGKDYFFKLGRNLYDRNKFQIPEGAENVKISFVDNNYFELSFEYTPNFQEDLDSSLVLEEGFYKQKIYPDVEMQDGRIIEKPVMLVASMNDSRMDFAIKNNGLFPDQSTHLQSATAMTLGTQEFERVFEGENGHRYVLTFVFRSNMVETPGIQFYKGDAHTPIPIYPNTEASIIDGQDLYEKYGVDPKKGLIMKLDNYTLDKPWIWDGKYFESPYKNKAKVLAQTLNILMEQAKIDIEATVDTKSQESINARLSDIISVLDKASRVSSTRNTRTTLKARVNRQSYTPAEVFDMARNAAKSLYTVFNSDVKNISQEQKLSFVAKAIEFGMNNALGLSFQVDQNVIDGYQDFRKDFDTIIEYMNVAEYQIDSISEGNHPKADITMVAAAYITHMGENKNSRKYQDHVEFLRNNGVFVEDLINPNSVEEMKRLSKYEETQGNFFQTSAFKYNHSDKGNQSIVNRALNDDIENGLGMAFSIDVTVDPEAQTEQSKKKTKEQQPNIEGDTASTVQEQKAIDQTTTPTTQRKFKVTGETQQQRMNRRAFIAAQKRVQDSQQRNIYREVDRAYSDFTKNKYDSIIALKNKEFKNVETLIKENDTIIRQNSRGNRYVNHVTSSMLKSLTQEMALIYEKAKNDKTRKSLELTNRELDRLINVVNDSIFGAIDYMSDLTSKRYVSENNPTGMIYAKYSHWYLREFLEADLSTTDVLKKFAEDDTRGDFYRRLLNSIYNINKKNGFEELRASIQEFLQATDIETINDLSLRSGDTQRTQSEVIRQWGNNVRNIDRMSKTLKFSPIVKGNYENLLDPKTFLDIQGLFNDQSWASVVYKKSIQGQRDSIEVDRAFTQALEADGWYKQNFRQIKQLEREGNFVEIKQLGVKIPLTQVVFLRGMLAREIVRNRSIDLEIVRGNKSTHFENNNEVDLLALQKDANKKIDKRQTSRIKDNIALLNELDAAIIKNDTAIEYQKKTQEVFKSLFPFISERFVEIKGQPLQNEGIEIKNALPNLSEQQKNELFDGLPSSINAETIDNLYVPIYVGESGYFKDDNVNLKSILDLGVFDGMTQTISEGADGIVKVDSITNVIYKYKQEVRNYYGLHRLMSDWNNIVNQPMPQVEGETQKANFKKLISSQAINYVEKMLSDMAGYKSKTSDAWFKRALAFGKKNFYRAALAANAKVIMTQITTLHNLSIIYGPNPTEFGAKMYKNLFMQLSPKNRDSLNELMDTNNIFYDRSFQPTFDIGEATTQGIDSNSTYNRAMDVLMSGMKGTDNAINKAFYLTLLETTNPITNALYTKEEANVLLEEGIINSQSSALDISKAPILRTENDILKLFIRFMGEPLKIQTQIFNSAKQLQYIKKLEKDAPRIKDELTKEESSSLAKLQNERFKLQDLKAKENTPDFASLEDAQQLEIRNDIKNQKVVVRESEIAHQELSENIKQLKDQMDLNITSRPKVKDKLNRKISASLAAMTYMGSLSVILAAILSDMGRLDDREEEEEIANYLARKMFVQMGNEFAGLFPFVRDIYGLVAFGYDIDTIADASLLQDSLNVVSDLVRNIVSGEEVNPYKVARDIAIFGARVYGFPARNIEKNILYGVMLTGNQDDYYRYRVLTGQRTATNKELSRAVIDGRDDLVEAIVETRMQSRQVAISTPVMDEVIRLARVNANVTLTGIRDSYTIDGVEYSMTPEEKMEFTSIYNQADLVIQSIITTPQYARLNDEKKASIMRSIYNYYLRLAQDKVLGVDVLPESRTFRTLNQTTNYFRTTVASQLLTEQRKEERQRD